MCRFLWFRHRVINPAYSEPQPKQTVEVRITRKWGFCGEQMKVDTYGPVGYRGETVTWRHTDNLNLLEKGAGWKEGRQREEPSAKHGKLQCSTSHSYDSRTKLSRWLWSVCIWQVGGRVSPLILMSKTLVLIHESFLSFWYFNLSPFNLSLFSFIFSILWCQGHSGVRNWRIYSNFQKGERIFDHT